MKHKKEIVTLILSLTPRERRFFKKTYSAENEFVKLFDYIIKYRSFSVPEFNQYLAKVEGREELYTSGYISTIRQYLRDKLLASLRKIHRNDNPTIELWNDLGVFQILMNKGLIDIAENELNPAHFSKGRLFPLDSLTLLQQQSILQFAKGYKESTRQSINSLYDERISQAKQHLIEIELARTISLLSYYLQKDIKKEEFISEIEKSEVMQSDYSSLCFTNKYLIDWAYAQLFLLKNDISRAFTKFYKVINLWLQNPEMIKAYPDIFIGCCQYYLKFTQYKYAVNFKIEELEFINQVLISFRNAANQLGLSNRIEKYISYFEISLHVVQKEFEKVMEKEPVIKNWIQNSTDLSQFSKNYLNFMIGYAGFRVGNFELCLEKTETIIFNKENIHESPHYFSRASLLYLMCHLSAGNELFVMNEYKKRRRSLERKGLLFEYEELFFSFLHNFFLKRNSDKKVEVIESFKEQFLALAKENENEPRYQNLPIQYWFDSILSAESIKV